MWLKRAEEIEVKNRGSGSPSATRTTCPVGLGPSAARLDSGRSCYLGQCQMEVLGTTFCPRAGEGRYCAHSSHHQPCVSRSCKVRKHRLTHIAVILENMPSTASSKPHICIGASLFPSEGHTVALKGFSYGWER